MRTMAVLVLALAALAGCRKAAELPAVPGARKVVPFSAVRLFREMPVSNSEFDATERRWSVPTSPRFDGGTLRSRPGADGGTVFVEIPPVMAFRNRRDDCGSINDRRVCALRWDETQITLCGRPLDGHVDIRSDKLGDAALLVCRVITPAHDEADGGYAFAERDCSRAERIPLRSVDPHDLVFRVGDIALVSDPGATYDTTVCARVAQVLAPPAP